MKLERRRPGKPSTRDYKVHIEVYKRRIAEIRTILTGPNASKLTFNESERLKRDLNHQEAYIIQCEKHIADLLTEKANNTANIRSERLAAAAQKRRRKNKRNLNLRGQDGLEA